MSGMNLRLESLFDRESGRSFIIALDNVGAAAYGIACADANVLTGASGFVRTSDVEEIFPEVLVSKEAGSVATEGRGEC